jgi:hypothetical protein
MSSESSAVPIENVLDALFGSYVSAGGRLAGDRRNPAPTVRQGRNQ